MNPQRYAHPRHRLSILTVLMAVALPTLSLAQGSVTGVVKDAATHKPLKAVTAMLRDTTDPADKPIGDMTNDQGAFTIERVVFGKKYRLEIRYTGYETYVVEDVALSAEKPTRNFGEILLEERAIEAGEVKVTAEREQVVVLPDKTVYAVADNPSYTATNVSELLGQIPSVQVDQDGNISLRGNDKVTIMINDRPLTMPTEQRNKFLESLPANTVKDIEIRTNPGAKFDAKNTGGIINIVTQRTLSDMLGGNVTAGVDSRGGLNGGAGLFYNGEKLNASLGGGLYHGSHDGSSSSIRINYLDTNERRSDGTGTNTSTSNSTYGYGQIDYNITEHDLASLSFNLNHWGSDYSATGVHEFFNPNNDVVERFMDTSAPLPGSGNSGGYNNASLLLKHTFEGDHKISLTSNYNSFGFTNGSAYSSTYFKADGTLDSVRSSSRNSSSDRSNSTIITSLDYENPITQKFKLSLGAKNEINMLDNNTSTSNRDQFSGEFVLDPTQTSHYLPKNTIYGVYGEAAFAIVDGVNAQAGVRVEQANVSAKYASGQEIISRDYTNVFPSGSISYSPAQAHTITLSYRRSIALPDIDALNPTQVKWNDQSSYSGNPDLEPEFTQSFELAYNTYWGMGNMVSLSPYYSTTSGNIERNQQLIDGVTNIGYANFNGTYSIGSEASLMMRPFTWLNFRLAGNAYQKVNRGSDIPGDAHSSGVGYSGNASLNADIIDGLAFSMNGFFQSPPTVGNEQTSGFSYWSFALRQKLLDNKLVISLRVNDPFDLQKWHIVHDAPDFYMESTSKWSSRFVGLNISYNFGTTPKMERHKTDKTETKGGGGSGGEGGGGSSQGGGQ